MFSNYKKARVVTYKLTKGIRLFSVNSNKSMFDKKTFHIKVFFRHLKKNRRLFLKSNNLIANWYFKCNLIFNQFLTFLKKEIRHEYLFYRNLRVKDMDMAHVMVFFVYCCIVFTIYFSFFADR